MHLNDLGWDGGWNDVWAAQRFDGLVPARVVRIDKGGLTVDGAGGAADAPTTGDADRTLVVAAKQARDATVGDWCALDADAGRIVTRLPRRTVVERRSPGAVRSELAVDAKALAANVDRLFVLQSLDSGVNLGRLVRELIVAWESGAQPTVVLTKADHVPDDVAESARLDAAAASPDITVCVVSNLTGRGLDEVRTSLRPAETVALMGASGAGKSSLVNALAGRRIALTGSVRLRDRRGRHTTVAGQLLRLDDGALLIDTPGIRGVGLWRAWDGLRRTFADVDSASAKCRFEDCAHRDEPGCGVVEELDADRIALYHSMVDELDELEGRLEERQRELDRADSQRSRRRARRRDS